MQNEYLEILGLIMGDIMVCNSFLVTARGRHIPYTIAEVLKNRSGLFADLEEVMADFEVEQQEAVLVVAESMRE